MDKLKFNILNFYTIALLIFSAVSFLLYPILSSDSGYYLATAREFYGGKVYFIDVSTVYNPLAILTFGLPSYLFGVLDTRIPLVINFVFVFGSGLVLYKILSTFSNLKKVSVFFSLFFIVASLSLDGSQILLEPMSVLFLLLGFYYYLRFNIKNNFNALFWAGFFIALSFLAKQYGVLLLLPIGIDILLKRNEIFKKALFLAFGFALPVLVLFLYLTSNGASVLDFIKYISGKGIELDRGNGTGSNLSLANHLFFYFLFIVFNLYLFFIPLLAFKNGLRKTSLQLPTLALATMCLVLINASYLHYFQYILPFLIMVVLQLMAKSNGNYEKGIIASAFVSLLLMSVVTVYSALKKPKKLVTQNTIQKEINQVIPPKSQVYLDGISPAFYYLCDFQSIDLHRIGFCFPGYFSSKTIISSMKKGSFIVLSKESYKYYSKLTKGFEKSEIIVDDALYYILKKV